MLGMNKWGAGTYQHEYHENPAEQFHQNGSVSVGSRFHGTSKIFFTCLL